MWYEDRGYPKEEILVDPEGQAHRLRPVVATPKKWEIKYASGNTKPAEMKATKLSLLQTMIRGNVPSSFDNRQTHQTKAASPSDKITVTLLSMKNTRGKERKRIGLPEKWKICEQPNDCKCSKIPIDEEVLSFRYHGQTWDKKVLRI